MSKLKKTMIAVLSAVLVALGGYGAGQNLGATDFNVISNFTESEITTATTSAQLLLDNNSGRSYAAISNSSDTGVYLTFDATSTTPGGYWLASGENFEIDDRNMFFGKVYVSTTTAGKTITAVDSY